jgi:hypothetical protein
MDEQRSNFEVSQYESYFWLLIILKTVSLVMCNSNNNNNNNNKNIRQGAGVAQAV